MSSYTDNSLEKCPFCLSINIQELNLVSNIEEIPAGLSRSNQASFNGILCKDCKSVTSSNFFDEELYVEGFYSKSKNYDRIIPGYDYTGPFVKEITEKCKNGKALDFGAGQGAAAAHIKNLGINIDVLDPDEGYQEHLKNSFDTVLSDINEIEENYNCIYAIGVLEHLSDIPYIVSSLYEKLQKDGILVFQYPNPSGFSARFNLTKWDMLFENGHNYIPSVKGLNTMLKRHNLEIDQYYSSSILSRGRVPFLASRIDKLEKFVQKAVSKSSFLSLIYNFMWHLQGLLGLGETLVVIIKKN
jgi:SAM-dependent methyltransferase